MYSIFIVFMNKKTRVHTNLEVRLKQINFWLFGGEHLWQV